jgi:hypothetical protein
MELVIYSRLRVILLLSCIVEEEQVVEKQTARRTFGSERGKLTGKLRKLHNEELIICTLPLVLLGCEGGGWRRSATEDKYETSFYNAMEKREIRGWDGSNKTDRRGVLCEGVC